jgi:inorganic phosphate transporter, PiT family
MVDPFVLLIAVVIVTLAFDYVNGFHDTANAIATVVSTNVLPPRTAVLLAALFNFVGAFIGTGVAKTIGGDIADPASITQVVVLSALAGAITWNLITWWFGIPSSSSHALVGGIVGAALTHKVLTKGAAFGETLTDLMTSQGVVKVLKGLVLSPLAGFIVGFIIMIGLYWLVRRRSPSRVSILFRRLQLVSASLMALSHGSNDAQKAMGVVVMALVAYTTRNPNADVPGWTKVHDMSHIPAWVIVCCASAMALGTAAGGWRIMKTMGHKIIKLRPINGFAAETAGAA